MSYTEQEGSEELIFQALRQVKLDPHLFGKYILEKVAEDRNILELKKGIVNENDHHKIDYNDFKGILLQMEYLALILTKQKL